MELKIIGILAGVLAAIGIVLFGRSKDETQASKPAVEQVEPRIESTPAVETPPPLRKKPIDEPEITEITPEAMADTVIVPSAVESSDEGEVSQEVPISEAPMSMAAFKTASQARAVAASKPPVNESATPAVRSSAMATVETNSAPTMASPQVAPFSVKQDPERPETPALQNLSQDILLWGESGQLRHLPKLLQYAKHSDPQIRAYIAVALGQLASAQSVKIEAQPLVAPLQQLASDSDPKVQRLAQKSLAAC